MILDNYDCYNWQHCKDIHCITLSFTKTKVLDFSLQLLEMGFRLNSDKLRFKTHLCHLLWDANTLHIFSCRDMVLCQHDVLMVDQLHH